MDLHGYSINDHFRKCGEITTALKVGKKVYALNCGFCSKVFIKLHAFTVHVGENHEQEVFGYMDDENCKELRVDKRKKIITEFRDENDDALTTVESKCAEMIMDVETAIDFQDPLEQSILNVITENIPIKLIAIKEEEETMVDEGNYDEDEDMDKINEVEDNFKTNNMASSSDSNGKNHKNKFNDTGLTLAIIKGFKNNPVLWDTNDSRSKNIKTQIEAYKCITNSINKEMNTNLKWNNIHDRINKLRHKYHSEFQNEKLAKSKNENYTPIWYYDKLSFLNSKLRKKKINKAIVNEEQIWKLPLPTLTDSENLELIQMYKRFPCLWNVEHIEFHDTKRRQEAMHGMIQEIKTKINLNIKQDELDKILHSIRDAYTQETQRKLKCERLKKDFTPLHKFYEQVSFLKDNVRPFKCDLCKETFNGFSRYKIHKSQHDGSMPFTCPICKHGFTDVSNCIAHVRAHSRERLYFCEICGQSFVTRSSFNVHKRRHRERPNHICTICSKAFYEKFRLTEHMNAHLNIRNNVCNICSRAFTSSKYLRQHKQIHAEKKKYVCRICGKDFAQAAGLSGHMKSHGTTVSGNLP